MNAIHHQVFQAAWPPGHEPIFPPYTDVVASLALVIFATYYSTPLGIGSALALSAFWGIRKVAAWIIHIGASPLVDPDRVRACIQESRPFLRQQYHQIEMKTPDGLKLDGILHEGSLKKAVIYCPGNNEFYEDSAKGMIGAIEDRLGDVSVLCFNPRGVLESEGVSSPDKLPYDAYTAFEYLVHRGYQPQDICLLGHSLGGSMAVIGASYAQAKYPHVSLGVINVHSFSSLSAEVLHLLGNEALGKIAAILIRIWGWHLDVTAAWHTLKHPAKTVICHRQDEVIPFEASLFQAVPGSGRKILNENAGGPRRSEFHNDFPLRDVIPAIREILNVGESSHLSHTA